MYLEGKVKTLSQFAISEGIDPKNGVYKRDSTGWKREAEEKIGQIAEKAEEKAIEYVIERKAIEYQCVFDNLGSVAMSMSKVLKEWAENVESILNDPDEKKTFEEMEELFKINPKKIKSVLESSMLAHGLLKKIYTGDDIPLSSETKHEIEKAKEIKKAPESESKPDPTEGLTEQEIDQKIKELQ